MATNNNPIQQKKGIFNAELTKMLLKKLNVSDDELKKIDNVNKKFTYKDFVKKMDKEGKNYGTTSHFFVE